jgi:phosphatidate cytidylyltransferase
MHPIYYYIAGYFALGALAIFFINKKDTEGKKGERWKKYITYLVIVNLMVWSVSGPAHGTSIVFFIISLILVLTGFGELLFVGMRQYKGSASLIPMLIGIGCFLGISYAFLSMAAETNAGQLLFLYFVVFAFDGFSQITGQLLGRTKIAPRISPKKTLEGVIGGIVFGILSAVIAGNWIDITIPQAIALGAIGSTACLVGDLLASTYKRAFDVKDYSQLIPAHGGVLDRFDSLIFAGALYYLVAPLIIG